MSIAVASPLAPASYHAPEWFKDEQRKIFAANWIFVGFTDNLTEHNSYISTTIAGTPVIVRNMNGKLVAFLNVCTHRYSPIHERGCGKAAFRCPFHGWTFDVNGVPIGIPENEGSFGYSAEEKERWGLTALALDVCGRFIFVRQSSEGQGLREWLGTMWDVVEDASNLFTENYYSDLRVWECNWKIAVGITVEAYHAPYVHPGSFSRHIGHNKSEREFDDMFVPYGVDYDGYHMIGNNPLSFELADHLHQVRERMKLPRSKTMRGYQHLLLYPNTMLAIYSGVNVTIVRFDPVSPTQTRAERWLMTGRPASGQGVGGIMWRTYMKQWEDSCVTILGEDQKACEFAQHGVAHWDKPGPLGTDCEQRVIHLHNMIAADMKR